MFMGKNGEASEKGKRTCKGFPRSFSVMMFLVIANDWVPEKEGESRGGC